MASIAVRTARLHEAEEQWTIHAERDRIARELHDSLAQVLGVIHLQLRALETRAKDEASHGDGRRALATSPSTADEAYRDVREAILGLRETVREDDGLEGSLREYLRKYSRQTGIVATLTLRGRHPPRPLARAPRSSSCAWSRRRSPTPASTRRRSASPSQIDCTGPVASLTIEDDGVGFDPSTATRSMEGGFGLASMRERVEQVGGRIAVHTAPNEGTTVASRARRRGHAWHTFRPSSGYLLVDDQPLFRRALATLISAQFDMTVVGEARERPRRPREGPRAAPRHRGDGREHAGRRRAWTA